MAGFCLRGESGVRSIKYIHNGLERDIVFLFLGLDRPKTHAGTHSFRWEWNKGLSFKKDGWKGIYHGTLVKSFIMSCYMWASK